MFVSCMLIAQVKLGPNNSKIRWGKEKKEKILQMDISFVLNIEI